MLEKLFGLQNLHFDTLTLNSIRANWVKRWSKVKIILFIGPMMWISSIRDGNTWMGACTIVFRSV
jgi:hypothetical protein